jgi:quercetin dioxygenase-like cupin family protein
MKKYHLKNFTRGWIVGDFEPAVLKVTEFEFMVRDYVKGDGEKRHVHKAAHEISVVASGVFKMNGVVIKKGDIVHLHPGVSTDFECIEDGTMTVVKTPSVKGDKYFVENEK